MLFRSIATIAGLIGVTACATAPLSYTSAAASPAPTAFACAVRKINSMGYTVTNANKEAGFIAAEKQTSGFGTALLTGKKYQNALTVSIFEGDGPKDTRLRVTAGQGQEKAVGFGSGAGSKAVGRPSDAGIADAKSLLSACGTGEIQEQAMNNLFIAEARAAE